MDELDQWYYHRTGQWPFAHAKKLIKEHLLKGHTIKIVTLNEGAWMLSCAALINNRWVEL